LALEFISLFGLEFAKVSPATTLISTRRDWNGLLSAREGLSKLRLELPHRGHVSLMQVSIIPRTRATTVAHADGSEIFRLIVGLEMMVLLRRVNPMIVIAMRHLLLSIQTLRIPAAILTIATSLALGL